MSVDMQKKLAAFIITYERPSLLLQAIEKLFEQTLPPEKILIIDNSISDHTEKIITNLDPRVSYYRMGYNAGPAGGARKGLELLAKEGYKWIFWGDDDDPPPNNKCLEELLILGESYEGKCGQVGMVGHRFNRVTGTFRRVTNDELYNSSYVEVDSIGGGMCKLINSQISLAGVLPEEKLFFGCEELDFDLSTKMAGYSLIVHSKLFLDSRRRTNRLNFKHIRNRKKDERLIWRDYYSIRNVLYIMKKNKLYFAFMSNLAIAVIKSLMSYKHGIKYGNLTASTTLKALCDFGAGKYYKRERI